MCNLCVTAEFVIHSNTHLNCYPKYEWTVVNEWMKLMCFWREWFLLYVQDEVTFNMKSKISM